LIPFGPQRPTNNSHSVVTYRQ